MNIGDKVKIIGLPDLTTSEPETKNLFESCLGQVMEITDILECDEVVRAAGGPDRVYEVTIMSQDDESEYLCDMLYFEKEYLELVS